jgi:hypothetical protein
MRLSRRDIWTSLWLMIWVDRVLTWRGIAVEVTAPHDGKLITRRRYYWCSVKPFFRWYDLWIGVYIDRQKRAIYICPLPTIGVKVQL